MHKDPIIQAYPRIGHPLHRLIKQDEAAELIKPFLDLMPGIIFGMLDPDGELFAGLSGWDAELLSKAWEQAKFGVTVRQESLILRPLIIHGRLAGALLVWDKQGLADLGNVLKLVEAIGNGLVRLLEQAVEKRALGGELLDRYREINLLYRVAETIGSCLDPEWIPRLVLDQIQPVVSSDMALVLLTTDEEDSDPLHVSRSYIESAWKGSVGSIEILRRATAPVLDRVMLAGEPMIFNPETELFSTKESEIFPFHVLCVPLKVHELILGVLVLGRVKTRQEFTAGEAKLVSALAGQAAIALDTARLHQDEVKLQRLEEELSIGRQIQLSFLPESLPDIPGWDFAAMYRSAREVGGDLYDIIYSPGSPNLLNVVIADVTGKGVAAALFMAFTRTVLRLMSIEGGSPSQVLKNTNHHILQERKTAIFVSAFFASIDLRKGLIKYSNAGHDWPMLYDSKTHRIRHLDATGFLLGAFGEIEPDEYQAIMQPGDLLVFYTDGISEAFNSKNELYGTQRIENVITRNAWENADSLLQAILTDVEEFTNDEPQSDDLTILVIKRMEHGL